MVPDIFYLIFILTITVLSCLRKKSKIVRVFRTQAFNKLSPWTPAGVTALPRPPTAIVSGFAKNRCAHIFSVVSPELPEKS